MLEPLEEYFREISLTGLLRALIRSVVDDGIRAPGEACACFAESFFLVLFRGFGLRAIVTSSG